MPHITLFVVAILLGIVLLIAAKAVKSAVIKGMLIVIGVLTLAFGGYGVFTAIV